MTAAGIDRARQLFADAGLPFPSIPEVLAGQVQERDRWVFSTRPLKTSPYFLDEYVQEARGASTPDYGVLAHSGYGLNSYALQYYVVYRSARLFLHLGWGGVYTDPIESAAMVTTCFSLADRILAKTDAGLAQAPEQPFTVVESDFYGSHFLPPGSPEDLREVPAVRPPQALRNALAWLSSLEGRP